MRLFQHVSFQEYRKAKGLKAIRHLRVPMTRKLEHVQDAIYDVLLELIAITDMSWLASVFHDLAEGILWDESPSWSKIGSPTDLVIMFNSLLPNNWFNYNPDLQDD
jgi:hypothetical protein